MTLAILGAGLVGTRAARLASRADTRQVLLVGCTGEPQPIAGIDVRDSSAALATHIDIAVLACASDDQARLAERLLHRGAHVVSTSGDPGVVRQLLGLDGLARSRQVAMIVGAAYAPGLSSIMVAQLAASMDRVDRITTASFGTGGPMCAREHHRSMSAPAVEVRDGQVVRIRGGSGRSLVWFPEPVGAVDCFRAGLGEPLLLRHAFPDVGHIQALQAATRRDRLTARLPMMRPPHPEGLVGGLWAEVRGLVGSAIEHRVLAVTAPQASGAAATAVVIAELVEQGAFEAGVSTAAMVPDPASSLAALSESVQLWRYDGSAASAPPNPSEIHAARKWNVSR